MISARRLFPALLALVLGATTLVGGALPAGAALSTIGIVVDSADDLADAAAGDGICATAAGTCSLRAAIKTANEMRGASSITFAIPGNGPHTINVASELPAINDHTGPVTIDGYSQAGAAPNTATAGSNAVLTVQIAAPIDDFLLKIHSKENVLRGLAMFGGKVHLVIQGESADGNRIVGNFIGTDASGTYENSTIRVTGGETGVGVLIQVGADKNAIGAPTLADRNVISGNGGYAIRLNHGETTDNFVQNNVIGLNPQLTAKLLQWHGVDMQWWTSGNLIGGYGELEGNLVGGQTNRAGIEFSHGARKNFAIGNYVGTMGDGNTITDFSGNTYGISFKDGPEENYIANNVVGGNGVGIWHKHRYTGVNYFVNNRVGVGADGGAIPNGNANVTLTGTDQIWVDNIFANNDEHIRVDNYMSGQQFFFEETYTHANSIRQSQFYNVGQTATDPFIDITPVGENTNDPGDGDDGVQDLLNAPEITGIGPSRVFGTTCGGCTVEVYVSGSLTANGTLDTSGTAAGTGLAWIGTTVADDAGSFAIEDGAIVAGRTLSALTIDTIGNTSELRLGQTVPVTHQGVNGAAGTSTGAIDVPALPRALPTPYAYPATFECSLSGSSLSWTGAAPASYGVHAEIDGSPNYIGTTTENSLSVPPADEYRVRYRISGTPYEATCPGTGSVEFSCSVDGGVLSWTSPVATRFYVKSTVGDITSYVGSTTELSLAVPAADSYQVRYWQSGSPSDSTCDGPGVAPFECSVDGEVLSWPASGSVTYYLATIDGDVVSYLGSTTDTSYAVPEAEAYRVRFRVSGVLTEAVCGLESPVLVNLALAGTATQSSISHNGAPSRANDGDTGGRYGDGSVSHTHANSPVQPWWDVDLGTEADLEQIVIWNRTDCCTDRLSNFHVLVSDEPFGDRSLAELLADGTVWSMPIAGLADVSLTVDVDRTGRYVRVQREDLGVLSLAEVQVFGF